MLMMLGPIIFAVPTFSAEGLDRQVSARAEPQPVIGAPPPVHLLGPNADTLTITCTFYPFHLNGGGLAQLAVLQEMCRRQVPLMFVSIGGLVFGRWVVTSVGENQTFFHPRTGAPQRVDVTISLTKYVGGRTENGFGVRIGFF